jgi:hypothetical protein
MTNRSITQQEFERSIINFLADVYLRLAVALSVSHAKALQNRNFWHDLREMTPLIKCNHNKHTKGQ